MLQLRISNQELVICNQTNKIITATGRPVRKINKFDPGLDHEQYAPRAATLYLSDPTNELNDSRAPRIFA